MSTGVIEKLALDVIAPLCDETRRMFREICLPPSDRISLRMSKDAKNYHLNLYQQGEDGSVWAASYNARVHFPMLCPDRTQLTASKWHVGATDIATLLIAFHWAPSQIIFEDEHTKKIFYSLLLNFVAQTNRVKERNNIENFKFVDSKRYPLAGYQVVGLKACMNTPGFGLFMEQGTGKTAIAIARICNEALQKEDGVYRVLVICPNAVRLNWKEEIKKFASCRGVVEEIAGTPIQRVKTIIDGHARARLNEEMHYFAGIVSMDSVGNTEDAFRMVPWDLAIIDESQGIKNPETKRWKAMVKLRGNCKSRMVLTGTPITNTMFDLWTQFEFMGEGYSGFTSFKKFKNFYGNFQNAGQNQAHGYRKLVELTNIPMIQERLARQAYLITKKQALPDLPDKVYDIHAIEMTKEQEVVYRQLCEDLMAEFESQLAEANGKKDMLIVNNILTQMLRLAQITSGFVGLPQIVDEDGNTVQEKVINRFDPNPKIEACVELLKDKEPQQKTIIWSNWVQNIKTLKARLDIEKIKAVTYYGGRTQQEREASVKAFNEDPDTKCLIGNPSAGGMGINLLGYPIGGTPNTYCDHVIYFSQNWSATDRSQSEDRPHRRGTATHVRYTDLVVPATIDEEIRERVLIKRNNALKIQNVRDVIQRMMRG